ncbi:tyrosine 3-monooxygenase-like [Tiliqua scincoides]|uniref:tyrosine 3-monooxygenase-like n=1 Tax=Tiliqua scincoides TaxID=71010 RepID=UPI003462A5C7
MFQHLGQRLRIRANALRRRLLERAGLKRPDGLSLAALMPCCCRLPRALGYATAFQSRPPRLLLLPAPRVPALAAFCEAEAPPSAREAAPAIPSPDGAPTAHAGAEGMEAPHQQERATLSLTLALPDGKKEGISRTARVLETFNTKIHHLETRPAKTSKNTADDLELFVRCEVLNCEISSLINSLKRVAEDVKTNREEKALWFPRKIRDLDSCHHLMTKYDPDFDCDHPGYTDPEYRKRRAFIADLAFNFRHGDPLPRVEYTAQETATWREIYQKLSSLYPTHACDQYLAAFHQLEKYCGYQADCIPQLRDVSAFLRERTGFQLRPASGLLSARDFLAGLAFRVFWSTQYIRHSSSPMHSPEPDCCHELLGHVPMLANKEFAQFSQDIGLASLGASDADLEKLSTLYWFSVEFGLCKQNGSIKAYGAGLLSSYGELMYALSKKPEYKPFNPEVMMIQPYQDQTFQPIYFVAENLEDAKLKLQKYALHMKKTFSLHYDPFTCSIDVLDSPQKVKEIITHLKEDLKSLCHALEKLS